MNSLPSIIENMTPREREEISERVLWWVIGYLQGSDSSHDPNVREFASDLLDKIAKKMTTEYHRQPGEKPLF